MVFQGGFKGVSRKFRKCFKGILKKASMVFQERLKGVSRDFKLLSSVIERSSKGISRKF